MQRGKNVKENKEEYQKEYQDKEYNRKLKYLAGIVVITFSVYVSFKYLLVYVWPFVLGVLAALLLEKPVNSIYMWICKRIRLDKRKVHAQRIKEHRIKSIIATIIMLIISVVIIILLAAAVITGANEISDFLKIIGCSKAVLYYEEIRVYRDAKNKTNRLNNCEQANMDRVIDSAMEQLNYIRILEDNMAIELLDDKTKEALEYRKKYQEASLKELSEIISLETGKKITKSGLNHRFRKIKELALKFFNN